MTTGRSWTVPSGRTSAMLRAVADGRAEIVASAEPDVFIDWLACCDQMAAHALTHAGLIRPVRPAAVGSRVKVRLTEAGWSLLGQRAVSA